MRTHLFIIICAFILTSCDALMEKEIARMPITKTSNVELNISETTMSLKKDDKISFWTDIDMSFDGELELIYTVEIWKDGSDLGGIKYDALKTNPTIMEVKSTFGGHTSWSYEGKMGFYAIEEDGEYTFKASLNSSHNPSLILNKADLVLKK